MGHLFPEEKQLAKKLVEEWYMSMQWFRDRCKITFDEKAKTRDQESLFWERSDYPGGMLATIRQKCERLPSLALPGKINYDLLIEELGDIHTYCEIVAGITKMLQHREGLDENRCVDWVEGIEMFEQWQRIYGVDVAPKKGKGPPYSDCGCEKCKTLREGETDEQQS